MVAWVWRTPRTATSSFVRSRAGCWTAAESGCTEAVRGPVSWATSVGPSTGRCRVTSGAGRSSVASGMSPCGRAKKRGSGGAGGPCVSPSPRTCGGCQSKTGAPSGVRGSATGAAGTASRCATRPAFSTICEAMRCPMVGVGGGGGAACSTTARATACPTDEAPPDQPPPPPEGASKGLGRTRLTACATAPAPEDHGFGVGRFFTALAAMRAAACAWRATTSPMYLSKGLTMLPHRGSGRDGVERGIERRVGRRRGLGGLLGKELHQVVEELRGRVLDELHHMVQRDVLTGFIHLGVNGLG